MVGAVIDAEPGVSYSTHKLEEAMEIGVVEKLPAMTLGALQNFSL